MSVPMSIVVKAAESQASEGSRLFLFPALRASKRRRAVSAPEGRGQGKSCCAKRDRARPRADVELGDLGNSIMFSFRCLVEIVPARRATGSASVATGGWPSCGI